MKHIEEMGKMHEIRVVAEWLTGFVIRFIPCELTVLSEKIKTYKNDILEWLKEAHNG
jgi:hypothetical protein